MRSPTTSSSRRIAMLAVAAPLVCLAYGSTFAGHAAAAPIDAGAVTLIVPLDAGPPVPITSGGSTTQFKVNMPFGATCSGDSTAGGYRVQTFIVPATDDLSKLTFDPAGPTPQGFGAATRVPLYTDPGQSPLVDLNTALASSLYPGQTPNTLGPTSFAVFDTTNAPAPGTYSLGVACTGNGRTLDKYWSTQVTFVADAADPAGVKFTVTPTEPTDSTTTTTTTTTDPTTDSTTTTTDPSTSLAGSGSGSGTAGQGTLPSTGTAVGPVIMWAVLVLIFGRLLVLVGHRARVLPPRSK